MPSPLSFVPYHQLEGRPNVVVDGSPAPGTVLTLTHWPRYPAPAGLARDLSAQIAFAYLDAGADLHGDAAAASNNHFDQDGLVGLLALTRPDEALARRDLLEDLAAAGDFATYRDRRAARLSMAVAAYADAERSPLALEADGADRDAQLYDELLQRLPEWCDEPGVVRALWAEEDALLEHSEALLAGGTVTVTEHPEVDLAVFDLPSGVTPGDGHRFAHLRYAGLHPMAVANATGRFVILIRQGDEVVLRYRYESWVQYCTRRPRARRALRPLADLLISMEPGALAWEGSSSGGLEPTLAPVGGRSEIPPADLVEAVTRYLASAPPDWDPYRTGA